jgi:hypothetical protein
VNKKKNSTIYFQSSLLENIRNLGLSSLPNMLQSHPIRLTIRVLDRCDDRGCEAPFIPHFLRTDTPVTCLFNVECAIKNRIVEEMELEKRQCIDQATYGAIRGVRRSRTIELLMRWTLKFKLPFSLTNTNKQTQAFTLLPYLHTATVIVSPSCTRIGARRGTKRGNQENIPGVRIENKKMVSITDE